jgi:hypothetical protein
MTGITLAFQLLVLGLHVIVPWRLAGPAAQAGTVPPAASDRRRLWALVATPLLLAAAIAGLSTLGTRLDAALAWGLSWPPSTLPGLALAVAAGATATTDLILLAGFRKLEPAGWRIAAGVGMVLLVVASFAGEILRVGRGPVAGLASLLLAALCRVPLALAAGEATVGPVRRFAPLAGIALPLSLLGFSADVRGALGADLLTLGAAAALLLAARFLPPTLRRPAVFAGVLLAALFLDRTGDLSAAFEPTSTIPDLFLPEP